MKTSGMTLIELVVVISIIGILLVALGLGFSGWTGKYKVESQTNELYADLMDARIRAMQKKRVYFVMLAPTSYSIVEDTYPPPDGNGRREADSDTLILDKDTTYRLIPKLSSGTAEFSINNRGLLSDTGNIRLDSEVSPDYDCIVLSATRINMGLYDKDTGECNAK
ncbi:MAG: prepilin-type N-terminal cleavage/methylation domain-containing protein [Nitrospirae bacterium]|nr:prepilin-type N-terminal cleavage/methylation domain-containing protein [Nitrospirota bacterium]